jgi:predicted ribosome-associated RNA-binding protein Tma20
MQRIIGSICSIGGLIALIYTLINYINNSDSFSFLGADVVVSEGNIAPVIVSAIVMIIGIVILSTSNKNN